jgi:hypothetical protein
MRRKGPGILQKAHALYSSLSLERNPRASAGAVAQPISAVANGNLLRRQDAADPLPGVLGIRLEGEK